MAATFMFFRVRHRHPRGMRLFCLSELESVSGPGGLTVERDLHFRPGSCTEVLARHRRERG